MNGVASITVTPQQAASAYAQIAEAGTDAAPSATDGFGSLMQRALQGVVDAGHQADQQATQAIAGTGSITDVVMAVSRAELALHSTLAIRDRVVQAYQQIMQMPI